MKVIILAVLVACAAAAPIEEESIDISPSRNVEVLVNGVAEGEALEIGHILGIDLHEQTADTVLSSNVLQPLSAAAIAEAAAAAPIPEQAVILPELIALPPEAVVVVDNAPEPVALPEPIVMPEPIVLPEPAAPEVVAPVPAPVELPPAPAPEVSLPGLIPVATPELVVPGGVEPAVPEVIPESVDTPVSGDVYNDGLVQVTINAPQDQGILSTLSSWMSFAISYVTGGVKTTNVIV